MRWVNDKNVEAIWESGKLIVKVSFGEDHDKNFLAAATAFVKTGLLPRAKSYLSQTTAEAVDLFMTRTILVDSRRSALRLFNEKFGEISDGCRETYFKIEEIEAKRLFRRVLLQEYYFFGESVIESAPRPEHHVEADEFLEWLYSLATREQDEASELAFKGEYLRVGVILVAREETYRQFGIGPYLRRANKYAAEHFQTIYLLSRGSRRSRVTKDIANQLTAGGNFTELTDRPDLVISSRGAREVITIIPLKADLAGITHSAWEKLQEAHRSNESVTVVVQSVNADVVTVSAFGLLVDIPLEELSELQIADARRYFRDYQELEVRALEIDPEKGVLRLSNRLTRTDPKIFVDELKEAFEDGAVATVVGYRDVDGYEIGLQVSLEEGRAQGFIPRSKATFSKFIVLSQKYPQGTQSQVKVLEFAPRYNSFLCEVAGRLDPWAEISRYRVGENYQAVLRQISERSLVYELEEGVEGIVFVEEVSWQPFDTNFMS